MKIIPPILRPTFVICVTVAVGISIIVILGIIDPTLITEYRGPWTAALVAALTLGVPMGVLVLFLHYDWWWRDL